MSTNASTSGRSEGKRAAKARIAPVSSRPVAGCTRARPRDPRTRRIGAQGTPSPISTSGQTGISSTCPTSRRTRGHPDEGPVVAARIQLETAAQHEARGQEGGRGGERGHDQSLGFPALVGTAPASVL